MADSQRYTEKDVVALAKVAGASVLPENREAIASNLSALRSGVLAKARSMPEDLGPILMLDPRWGGRK